MIKAILLLIHTTAAVCLMHFPRQVPTASNQLKTLNFRPIFVTALSFGHKRMVSSFYWVTTMIQADIERPVLEGGFSWLYYRFLQIAHLDPFFYDNYAHGGLYLSIVKDDAQGAKDIFERGLAIYRDDFWLNYYGAFNDLFELGDLESALAKYRRVLEHPLIEKNSVLKKVIIRIVSAGYEADTAYRIFSSLLQTIRHERARKKIEGYLYALKAQGDLGCLNEGRVDGCSFVDYFGDRYYRDKGGRYKAVRQWKKFGIRETASLEEAAD